jgi:hypothetical protein
MATENVFLKNLKAQNLIDDRQIVVMADVSATNGNRGRAFVLLNGTELSFYEPAGFADLGEWIETIDLKQAKFMKGSSFILHTSLKLECGGVVYSIQGFSQAAMFINAVKESCGS